MLGQGSPKDAWSGLFVQRRWENANSNSRDSYKQPVEKIEKRKEMGTISSGCIFLYILVSLALYLQEVDLPRLNKRVQVLVDICPCWSMQVLLGFH